MALEFWNLELPALEINSEPWLLALHKPELHKDGSYGNFCYVTLTLEEDFCFPMS